MQSFEQTDPIRWQVAQCFLSYFKEEAQKKGKELQPKAFDIMAIAGNLKRPPEAHLGDYAFGCFRFAGGLGLAPPQLASKLAEEAVELLAEQGIPATIDAAGPYANITFKPGIVAKSLLPRLEDDTYFERYKGDPHKAAHPVMIEYSQPNTHKTFHVGHVRNVALGDCLWRLYEYMGYPVIPVNYIGDEGTHIAKCLWYIKRFDQQPSQDQKPGEWLGDMYVAATRALEEAGSDKELQARYQEEISAVLAGIESKTGDDYEQWLRTRDWSLDIFEEIYSWLGARFDHCFYESGVSAETQLIVDEYLEKGVFVEDQGAVGVDLKAHKAGFALFRKRDGNTLYAAKDLALARVKYRDYNVDRSIYVVASEQNLHFKQVFKTLELMGFEQASKCYHLSYAHVLGPDGKMSSRAGTIIPFSQLRLSLTAALDEKLSRYEDEWSGDEIASTNHKIAVGAIRYGMLASDPSKEIVFHLERWLEFSGDTGPYLMYSLTRARSILRSAEEKGMQPGGDFGLLAADEERILLAAMYDFNDTVEASATAYKPSVLTHSLFQLCKSFSRFHKNHSVLKAESGELAASRLSLVAGFAKVLDKGLQLLGIEAPQRM